MRVNGSLALLSSLRIEEPLDALLDALLSSKPVNAWSVGSLGPTISPFLMMTTYIK